MKLLDDHELPAGFRYPQNAMGGTIHRMKPRDGMGKVLGPIKDVDGVFRSPVKYADGSAGGWTHHEVVVKNGRVYDALTGPYGQTLDEYKARWRYADAIDFGWEK